MQESTKILRDNSEIFHKHLSKFSCLMIGIGGLIGGGIFSVIGVISPFTGAYSYLSYLITGIVALFTVYSYHKLTNKWCNPGGEYTCVQMAFSNSKMNIMGPFIGFLLYFGYIASMALYAYTFSVYFIFLLNIEYNLFLISMVALFLFFILMVLNLRGVKESARAQNIFVVIKIIILLFFIVFGLLFAFRDSNQLLVNVGLDINSLKSINISGIIIGSTSIIVSYQGFQLITYASYEMEDVENGLKMMKWSFIISMILYVFVAFTAVAVLGVNNLIGNTSQKGEIAIARAALNFMGPFGMIIMIIGVLLSTASALNATMIGSSRLAYMISVDGYFPKMLSKVSKSRVPHVSIIITGFLSILLTILTGGALTIAGIAGLIFAQIFFIMNFTNFKVRRKINSKTIFPLIGMIFTSIFFIILLIYKFINIRNELISLVSFFIIELAALLFVFHRKNKNNYKD